MDRIPRSRQAGVSLVELVIALAAMLAVVGILTHVFVSTHEAKKYSERLHLVTEINQELLDTMQKELRSSVTVMTNNRAGRGYQNILDVSGGPAPIRSSTLPTVEPTGIFERELHPAQKTGNALLFARRAWRTDYKCRTGAEYQIEVFRLVYYYLAKQDPGPQPGSNVGLELCKFVSEPLADGNDIDGISDPADRSEVLRHLVNQTPDRNGRTHDRVEAVWRRDAEVVDLRQIDAGAGSLRADPIGPRSKPWSIQRAGRLSSNGLLGIRKLSVVSNFAQASYKVGRFSVMDFAGDGFPHGFEVQVIGPSFAMEVMLRMVIASDNPTGLQAKSDMRSDVPMRDFWSRRSPR